MENLSELLDFKFKLMNLDVCDDLRNKVIGVEFIGMICGFN